MRSKFIFVYPSFTWQLLLLYQGISKVKLLIPYTRFLRVITFPVLEDVLSMKCYFCNIQGEEMNHGPAKKKECEIMTSKRYCLNVSLSKQESHSKNISNSTFINFLLIYVVFMSSDVWEISMGKLHIGCVL